MLHFDRIAWIIRSPSGLKTRSVSGLLNGLTNRWWISSRLVTIRETQCRWSQQEINFIFHLHLLFIEETKRGISGEERSNRSLAIRAKQHMLVSHSGGCADKTLGYMTLHCHNSVFRSVFYLRFHLIRALRAEARCEARCEVRCETPKCLSNMQIWHNICNHLSNIGILSKTYWTLVCEKYHRLCSFILGPFRKIWLDPVSDWDTWRRTLPWHFMDSATVRDWQNLNQGQSCRMIGYSGCAFCHVRSLRRFAILSAKLWIFASVGDADYPRPNDQMMTIQPNFSTVCRIDTVRNDDQVPILTGRSTLDHDVECNDQNKAFKISILLPRSFWISVRQFSIEKTQRQLCAFPEDSKEIFREDFFGQY
jgi:hypothetical protein